MASRTFLIFKEALFPRTHMKLHVIRICEIIWIFLYINLKIKWYSMSINLDSYIHILQSYRYLLSKYYLPFTIYPSDSTSLQRSRRVAWYITCVRSYVNMNRTFSGILWKCNIEALDWRWHPRSILSNLHRKRQWPSVTPRSPSGWVRQLHSRNSTHPALLINDGIMH